MVDRSTLNRVMSVLLRTSTERVSCKERKYVPYGWATHTHAMMEVTEGRKVQWQWAIYGANRSSGAK